jgi:VanZ family protein
MALLLYALTMPVDPDDLPGLPLWFDKPVHALLFGVLAWLWLMPLLHALRSRRVLAVLLSIAIACAYGLATELLQARLPYRSADPWDVLANSLGALTAGLALVLPRRRV